MKYLITALFTLAFTNQALACTGSESQAEARLISMFQINGKSEDWVSVKIKKNPETGVVTLLNNRSFPVTVQASRRINSSRIIYKRDVYDLNRAQICSKGSKILIVHPKGEILVSRVGKSLGSAEIRLQHNGGVFKLKLRPKRLL